MQPNVLKLIAIGLVTLSLVLAIVGYRLSSNADTAPMISAAAAPQSGHATVIAVRDIALGETLQAKDLAITQVPVPVNGGFAQIDTLLGRTVQRGISQAEVLRENMFNSASALVQQTRSGYRAVAVTVNESVSAGGFLQPGDHVDIFYAVHSGAEIGTASLARLIVRDARILALGDSIGEQQAADIKKEESGKRSRSAVLEVTPIDVSRLLLAETTGTLRLAAIGERESSEPLPAGTGTGDAHAASQHITLAELAGAKRAQPPRRIEIFNGDQSQHVVPKQ